MCKRKNMMITQGVPKKMKINNTFGPSTKDSSLKLKYFEGNIAQITLGFIAAMAMVRCNKLPWFIADCT